MNNILYLVIIWCACFLFAVAEAFCYGIIVGHIMEKYALNLEDKETDKYILFSFEALWSFYSLSKIMPSLLRWILIIPLYAVTSPFVDIPVLFRIDRALLLTNDYKEKLKDLKNRVEEDMKNG